MEDYNIRNRLNLPSISLKLNIDLVSYVDILVSDGTLPFIKNLAHVIIIS